MQNALRKQNVLELEGMRVLVVEDEAIIAWALADSLESEGCEVVGPAYNLAEAIRLSEKEGIDGAVLDVNLGKEKVFPLADSLAGRSIPYCFVTGYGVGGLRPEDLCRPILQKPVDAERIVEVVRDWRQD